MTRLMNLSVLLAVLLGSLLLVVAATTFAEQKERLGNYDVHYVVVRSSFVNEAIAERYGIVRGRDRALMNISILDDGEAVRAELGGTVTNLLEQQTMLEFREVQEGPAIYYLAEVRYTDRETLRFAVDITLPDGETRTLRFQQKMYWDGR